MNFKPGFEDNSGGTKWNTKQKNMVRKYEDLLEPGVKKNELLGKYQIIFDILKQMR